MLRQQHRLKIKSIKKNETWGYKILMAIPRNLVYVFACVILIAFLGMLYVVYTGKNLNTFLLEPSQYNYNVVVHPLFEHFKANLPLIDEVPAVHIDDMTPKMFYKEFLSNNIPVLVQEGAANWPAIQKWKNKQYLSQEFASQSLLITKLDRKTVNPNKAFYELLGEAKRNIFEQFMNLTQNGTEGGRYSYYIKNEMIISRNLQSDFIKPAFITKVIRNRLTGVTIWKPFVRVPEYKERDRYYCVISGLEEFRLVSPVFKQNIYSGVIEELTPSETPLDFFNFVNRTTYPLFNEAKVLSVHVPEGSCLYIPAYFWVQSQTKGIETMMVNFEYQPISELSTLLFQAIDKGILE